MANFSTIAGTNRQLVRKSLGGGFFLAPIATAAITRTNLFEEGGGIAAAGLPVGYESAGLLTEDGIRFGRSQENDSIGAWQSLTPVREERTSDTETIQVDMLETRRISLEVYTGADLSAATYTNGALSIQKPEIPTDRFYRALSISVDSIDGDEMYVVNFHPNVKVTTWAEQQFGKAGALTWGTTFTAYNDDTLGYSRDTMIGGPGFATLAEAMGLPAVT